MPDGANGRLACERSESITPWKHSLMLTADMLGRTPRTLADLVAYLQPNLAR